MFRFCFALALIAAVAAPALLHSGPARAEEPPLVLELFTSQGCSACPPADALLDELARRPGLIALSLPISYWDHLGWSDTLASAETTARQRAYARQLGNRSVYTPQLVIAGTQDVVGSRRADIDAALAKLQAGERDGPALALNWDAAGLTISLDGDAPAAEATVWVLPYSNRHEVDVLRGENRGRTLAFTHVVSDVIEAGTWQGGPLVLSVPASELAPGVPDASAVLVQQDRHGAILAAGVIAPTDGP